MSTRYLNARTLGLVALLVALALLLTACAALFATFLPAPKANSD